MFGKHAGKSSNVWKKTQPVGPSRRVPPPPWRCWVDASRRRGYNARRLEHGGVSLVHDTSRAGGGGFSCSGDGRRASRRRRASGQRAFRGEGRGVGPRPTRAGEPGLGGVDVPPAAGPARDSRPAHRRPIPRANPRGQPSAGGWRRNAAHAGDPRERSAAGRVRRGSCGSHSGPQGDAAGQPPDRARRAAVSSAARCRGARDRSGRGRLRILIGVSRHVLGSGRGSEPPRRVGSAREPVPGGIRASIGGDRLL